jgi:hypothetical protein
MRPLVNNCSVFFYRCRFFRVLTQILRCVSFSFAVFDDISEAKMQASTPGFQENKKLVIEIPIRVSVVCALH